MKPSRCGLASVAFVATMVFAATVAVAQPAGVAEPAGCQSLASEQRTAPHAFEFGDMERLWGVIDQAKSGADPAPEQWRSLASGPGYASLIKEEIPQDVLFESIRVAFLPSRRAQKLQWQDQDKPALRLVDHFIELDGKRRAVSLFMAQLNREQAALSQRAMALACGYFAQSAAAHKRRYIVAFAAFQKDARGYSDSIVMDPLFALEAGDNLVYWLAHETHHYLRHASAVTTTSAAKSAAAQSLTWVLQQLQSEGIADQIDKPHTFFGSGYMAQSKFAEFFRAEAAIAPERIVQLDALMRELADCERDCDGIGERIRGAAKLAGHPLGYYMAGVIERTLGRTALLDGIGNPVRFLMAYNRAAIKDARQLPVFSDRSLAYASRLFAQP